MWKVNRLVLLGAALSTTCLTSRSARAEPPRTVECSWTCDCARELQSGCDKGEARWDICRDHTATRRGNVESCDACKELARDDCRKRTCPPDPKKGPKEVFKLLCDGKSEVISSLPPQIAEAMVTSPSLARPAREVSSPKAHGEARAATATKKPPEAKCTFDCACLVDTGRCDDQEDRSELCIDQAENTKTGDSCLQCRARAWLACDHRACPLVGGTRKVMINFHCKEG